MDRVPASGLQGLVCAVARGNAGPCLVEMSRERRQVAQCSPDGDLRFNAVAGGRPNGLAGYGNGCFWGAEASGVSIGEIALDSIGRQ